uniref:glucose-6-phosphate 1-epimerase n=1 Tax=Guillardia theta TaxID=55529 RepID=A0A7S4NU59_GUITH
MSQGAGQAATVSLRNSVGSKLEVAKHGAHVLTWSPGVNEESVLFVSPAAKFGPQDAIRGGIPICFPQFGPRGALEQHGFCRKNNDWAIAKQDEKSVEFELKDSESTRASAWPHTFQVNYLVELTDEGNLATKMKVKNTGSEQFTFTCALHTYFGVGDISSTSVEGLRGCEYEDSLQGGKVLQEQEDAIRFEGEVDRVYGPTPQEIEIKDQSHKRRICIFKSSSFPDAVVWNPWIEKSQKMADLPDDAYKRFVCVEVGAIRQPVSLQPQQEWEASQAISVKS